MKKDGYRVLFMGTPDFAASTLEALVRSRHEVVAVVTQPDKRKGRGKKLSPPPVKELAEKEDIPVLQPIKIKEAEFHEELRKYTPDVIVVTAYGRILPAEILTLPSLGCINVHGSLLPRHRGAAPIQWAVIHGDKTAGVTIMQMDDGMDTGDILLSAAIEVSDDETAGTLFSKLAGLGAETLLRALYLLKNGEIKAIPQDHNKATKAPPLTKEQGLIDWNKPAHELHCLIRGLDPWPSAYTFLKGRRIRLFSPQIVHAVTGAAPGSIVGAGKDGLLIATGKDALLIKELQPEGKKRLTVASFLCGQQLDAASRFQEK